MQRNIATVSKLNRTDNRRSLRTSFYQLGNEMMEMMGGMEKMRDMFKHPAKPKRASGLSPPNDRMYRGHIACHPSRQNGAARGRFDR